jgi:hypothetical protein
MQGNNATESMSQARLPRQVYDPSIEMDHPCLLPRALPRFSPHKHMEGARSCIFVPQHSHSNHTSNMFFHQSFIPQLRDCQTGGRGIISLLGQDHKLIAILRNFFRIESLEFRITVQEGEVARGTARTSRWCAVEHRVIDWASRSSSRKRSSK